jgi:flagellin
MAVTVGQNAGILKLSRQLGQTSERISNSFVRLSSGQRIAKSSDDSSGLAVADSLQLSARLASIAIRNANDGISSVTIADNAMKEIQSILQRQSELAQQASNGTFSLAQRSVIQTEFTALGSEVERIAAGTNFNGISLLSGSGAIVFQVGIDTGSLSQLSIENVQGTLQQLGLASTGSSALTYSLSGSTVTAAQSASRSALVAVNDALTSLSIKRGTLGAIETRLQATVNNLSVARENFTAAEGRIRDLDVAQEAANLTRLSILQQAGSAIFAQANQSTALALQLLK